MEATGVELRQQAAGGPGTVSSWPLHSCWHRQDSNAPWALRGQPRAQPRAQPGAQPRELTSSVLCLVSSVLSPVGPAATPSERRPSSGLTHSEQGPELGGEALGT